MLPSHARLRRRKAASRKYTRADVDRWWAESDELIRLLEGDKAKPRTVRRSPNFRKSDVKRLVRAAKDEGLDVHQVVYADGKVSIVTSAGAGSPATTPLEAWRAKRARQA